MNATGKKNLKTRNSREIKEDCLYSLESLYVHSNGEVTDPIVKLMGLTGIRILNDKKGRLNWPEAKIYLKSRALEDVVPAVQGKLDASISWFGDPSKARGQEDPKKLNLSFFQSRSIIKICIKNLKQGKTTYPHGTPKAVLFLGAALSSVRLRLAYLNELYDTKKLPFSLPVYVLTGERQLEEKIGETLENLLNPNNGIISFRKDWVPSENLILDEEQMIELVLAQSRHPKLDAGSIHFSYSPKGMERRATTESTVKQWLLDYLPAGGLYIAISNHPYNFYQECVIRRVLLQSERSDIYVKVIGPGMQINIENDDQLIVNSRDLINNTSRILYEILTIRNF